MPPAIGNPNQVYLEQGLPSPGRRDLGYWTQHTSPTGCPSIGQSPQILPRHVAISSLYSQEYFYRNYVCASGGGKLCPGSNISSNNTSGEFSPTPSKSSLQPSMTRTQEFMFIGITCIAQFLSLAAMNQTVSPVLVLAKHFHVEDYGTLSWFSAAFSMSVGTFILPSGRLGDMYGHKRIYLIGWLWFAAWSTVTGFSHTSNNILFSICRAFQGIGPALLVPNAIALIGRNLPLGQKRMIGFACFGACGPLGATAGAVFSALIADILWWPWSFWILAIVCLIVMGLAFVILPDENVQESSVDGRKPRFDYWGTITGVSGLVLINFALNQTPLVTWANPYIGTLLGVGCLFMVAFILIELYGTDHPLIPIRGLRIDAIFALTCITAGWASHGIWAYYLYLFLEHLRGHSALLSSAETSPVAITGMLFAFSTVWLIKRFGVSYVMFISMTCFMVGSLLLATMPVHQTYWAQTFVSILVMPGAMNLSYPAANILMSAALPKQQQGIAASLVSTMVNYSISCGLGLAGTIDRYTIQHEAERRGIRGNPVPLSDRSAESTAIRLTGLRAAYWLSVGFGGLGMVVALAFIAVTERRKRREKSRGRTLVELEKPKRRWTWDFLRPDDASFA